MALVAGGGGRCTGRSKPAWRLDQPGPTDRCRRRSSPGPSVWWRTTCRRGRRWLASRRTNHGRRTGSAAGVRRRTARWARSPRSVTGSRWATMAVADTSSTARTHVGEIDNHLTGGRMIRLQRRTPPWHRSTSTPILEASTRTIATHSPPISEEPANPAGRLRSPHSRQFPKSRCAPHQLDGRALSSCLCDTLSRNDLAAGFRHSSPTFGELIGRQGQCFYVPTYQRGFTWGSDQIERLFEDLFAGIDRVAAGDNPSTFLGSVIFFADPFAVDPRKPNALPTQVFHVVDGQQRLTTLLLVCSSLMRAAHQVLTELDRDPSSGLRSRSDNDVAARDPSSSLRPLARFPPLRRRASRERLPLQATHDPPGF